MEEPGSPLPADFSSPVESDEPQRDSLNTRGDSLNGRKDSLKQWRESLVAFWDSLEPSWGSLDSFGESPKTPRDSPGSARESHLVSGASCFPDPAALVLPRGAIPGHEKARPRFPLGGPFVFSGCPMP